MSSRTTGDQTYYEILGIPQEASPEDVKAAYRQAVLCLHPDKSLSTAPADADAYLKLHSAWQVLKDTELRAAYNKQLLESGHGTGLFISDEVDLDDMKHLTAQDGSQRFMYPCRCGEDYMCREQDLTESADSLLVQCQGCSLIIRVLYTVA